MRTARHTQYTLHMFACGSRHIWLYFCCFFPNLPDRRTDCDGKCVGPTQILPDNVRGPTPFAMSGGIWADSRIWQMSPFWMLELHLHSSSHWSILQNLTYITFETVQIQVHAYLPTEICFMIIKKIQNLYSIDVNKMVYSMSLCISGGKQHF